MDELTSWADCEPTRRNWAIHRVSGYPCKYVVKVWETPGPESVLGVGEGLSITFATVRAFDDLSAKMGEA